MPGMAQRAEVTRDQLEGLEARKAETLAELEALKQAETEAGIDLERVERDLIAAAMESRRREEQSTASEFKLISLRTRLAAARRDLIEGETALEGLVASLALSGRRQPPALVTRPDDANAAIRAAILLGDATPRVQARTIALGAEIMTLRRLEREERREAQRLAQAEAALAQKQAEIRTLAAIKRSAFENATGDAAALQARADQLGAETETLRTLLAALEANAPTAPGLKPKLQLASTSPNLPDSIREALTPGRALADGLSQPVSGRLVRQWRDKMPGGTRSEGLAYATRAKAQVTAPADGEILYVGSFRTYGLLLIIATSDDYHIALSGMAKSHVAVGQRVQRGTPVAVMADRALPEPELYLEVRKDGTPIDPAKWLKRG